MTPQRGELWTVADPEPRTVLVVSGNAYNAVPVLPGVLAMEVTAEGEDDVMTEVLPDGRHVRVDLIENVEKAAFTRREGVVDSDVLVKADNLLFKILATP